MEKASPCEINKKWNDWKYIGMEREYTHLCKGSKNEQVAPWHLRLDHNQSSSSNRPGPSYSRSPPSFSSSSSLRLTWSLTWFWNTESRASRHRTCSLQGQYRDRSWRSRPPQHQVPRWPRPQGCKYLLCRLSGDLRTKDLASHRTFVPWFHRGLWSKVRTGRSHSSSPSPRNRYWTQQSFQQRSRRADCHRRSVSQWSCPKAFYRLHRSHRMALHGWTCQRWRSSS